MKKLLIIFTLFLFTLPAWSDAEQSTEPEKKVEYEKKSVKEEKPPAFRLKNRGFELAFLNIYAGFGNSIVTAPEIFQKTAEISLENIFNGFGIGFGLYAAPLAININCKNKWGFGLDLGTISVNGNVNVSGDLLSLKKTDYELFGAGAAAYFDIGLPVFFHIRKLKIKIRPAAYIPLAHAEPGISYIFKEKDDGLFWSIKYDMYVYSPFDIDGLMSGNFDPLSAAQSVLNTKTIGFDFNTGLEFPLSKWLDFGVNISNIPLKPSVLNYYINMAGEVFIDTSVLDIMDLINGNKLPDNFMGFPEKFEYFPGTSEKSVIRPFKFIAYAFYRPFLSHIISLQLSAGLAYNPIFSQPSSFEGGLKINFDLINMLVTSAGVNYEDRLWKTGLDFKINLRFFELDIGIASQSPNFGKSFQLAGLGVNITLRMGL